MGYILIGLGLGHGSGLGLKAWGLFVSYTATLNHCVEQVVNQPPSFNRTSPHKNRRLRKITHLINPDEAKSQSPRPNRWDENYNGCKWLRGHHQSYNISAERMLLLCPYGSARHFVRLSVTRVRPACYGWTERQHVSAKKIFLNWNIIYFVNFHAFFKDIYFNKCLKAVRLFTIFFLWRSGWRVEHRA